MTDLTQILPRFANARIVVLGDVMLDRFVFGEVTRISPEAPIPVFKMNREEQFIGGAGNVARNIASLGGRATLIGLIGDDNAGNAIMNLSRDDAGIETMFTRDENRPSTTKIRYFAQNQQLFRVDEEQTFPPVARQQEEVLANVASAIESADILLLSDYAKGLLSKELVARAIALARGRDVSVVVDPKSPDVSRYVGATVITPNALEAKQMTGIDCRGNDGAAGAARAIAEKVGCSTVLVTRGEQGITVLSNAGGSEQIAHLPTAAREVFDVSGAGDVVVAAFSLAMAVKVTADYAAHLANLAAGIAVCKIGTYPVHADELLRVGEMLATPSDRAKVVDIQRAVEISNEWKRRGEKVVFTNGCFDLLHPGHVRLLEAAKAQGDKLIVAINSDRSVARLKGPGRPIQDEASRGAIMASIGSVDLVTVFSEDTPTRIIEAIRPEVIVKGDDYAIDDVVGADFVQSYGGRVVLAPLEKGHSTSNLVRKMSVSSDRKAGNREPRRGKR